MLHCRQWLINPLRLRKHSQFGRRYFQIHFLEWKWISLKISLKFVPKVWVNNILALVQIMAWCLPGDKPLSEPMMVSLLTHICVTRPQWVNPAYSRLLMSWQMKEPGHQQPCYWPSSWKFLVSAPEGLRMSSSYNKHNLTFNLGIWQMRIHLHCLKHLNNLFQASHECIKLAENIHLRELKLPLIRHWLKLFLGTMETALIFLIQSDTIPESLCYIVCLLRPYGFHTAIRDVRFACGDHLIGDLPKENFTCYDYVNSCLTHSSLNKMSAILQVRY